MKSHTFPLMYHFLISVDNGGFIHDNGVDLHSYQPTAEDIMKVSDCDLFVYVGGESDAWVDDALKQAKNKDMQVVNLLDVLGNSVKEEEVIEGMEPEEEEEGGEEEEPEYDEHVWLSVKTADHSSVKTLLQRIVRRAAAESSACKSTLCDQENPASG